MTTPEADVAVEPHGISRNHILWALLGLMGAAGMFWAATWIGVAAMFAAIGLAFVFWYRLGSRGSWMAMIMLGIGIAIPTTVMAVTGAGRCPDGNTKVVLKKGQPPVNCTQIRTGAASMAVMFWLITIVGIAAPIYASRIPDEEPEEDEARVLDV